MNQVLPDKFLSRMSASDRKSLGKAGKTSPECRADAMNRSERELQREIAEYLRMRGIEFINPPMNRRSTLPVGWPDFTFAHNGVPVAVEVKVWGETPRQDQKARHEAMRGNGWRVYVVSSLLDLREVLAE